MLMERDKGKPIWKGLPKNLRDRNPTEGREFERK
jgi:hypothetical protein